METTTKLPTAFALAVAFCDVVRDWLTAEELALVVTTNTRNGVNARTCALHDYCDANQAMLDAWEKLTGASPFDFEKEESEPMSDEVCQLIGEAWTLAKKAGFKLT